MLDRASAGVKRLWVGLRALQGTALAEPADPLKTYRMRHLA